MKKLVILILLSLPIWLNSQDVVRQTSGIKPGVKDITLGKTLVEMNELLTKKYKIQIGSDHEDIFSNEINMENYIVKFAPSIARLRDYNKWNHAKLVQFVEKQPYNAFVESVDLQTYLVSEYPLRFKRWKRFRMMLKNFNPFVQRVDLAYYRDVLYYARFYVKDRYAFNDTYLPENEQRFLMHLYVKYKRDYGQPILFNNTEYHWRDNRYELSLDGLNSTVTFSDFRINRLVVRYLKNVSIILSRMQVELTRQGDYVEHHLQDF